MKKKIIFALLASASVVALASCGENSGTTETSLEMVTTVPEGFTKMDTDEGYKEVEALHYDTVSVTEEDGTVNEYNKEQKLLLELQDEKNFVVRQKNVQTSNDYTRTLESRFVFDFTDKNFSAVKSYSKKYVGTDEAKADYVYEYETESYGTWDTTDGDNSTFTAVEHAKINISDYMTGVEVSATYNAILEEDIEIRIPQYESVDVDKTVAFSGTIASPSGLLDYAYTYIADYAVMTPAVMGMYYHSSNVDSDCYSEFYKNADGDILMNFVKNDDAGESHIMGFTLYEDGLPVLCGNQSETGESYTIYSCEFTDEDTKKMEKTDGMEEHSNMVIGTPYTYFAAYGTDEENHIKIYLND